MTPTNRRHAWTLEDALHLIDELNPAVRDVGFATALTGSVLFKRRSCRDLDIILYPLNSNRVDHEELRAVLQQRGWLLEVSREQVYAHWESKGDDPDRKHVEIWRLPDGRRVDVFLLQ